MGALLAYMVVHGLTTFPNGVPGLWLEDTRYNLKLYVESEEITIAQYEDLTGETYVPN